MIAAVSETFILRLARMAALSATASLFAGVALAQSCVPDHPTGRVLANFIGGADGAPQSSGVVFREGSLYGVTATGGTAGGGSVFRLSPPVPPATTWSKTAIALFKNMPDGRGPSSGLLLDSDGSFYGVTYQGGPDDKGMVYKLVAPKPPSPYWSRQVIHAFAGGADGMRPVDEPVMDSSGALYGVLAEDVTNGGRGAIYRLTPPVAPATAWTNTIIYRFLGGLDGSMPRGPLLLRNGELYGVTHDLGDTGRGTVFRLTPPVAPAPAWTKTILHRFPNVPNNVFWAISSRLLFDTEGSLYGTLQKGGAFGYGAVYKLTRAVSEPWSYSTLYSFKYLPNDVATPTSGLTFDSAGALYGVAHVGGANSLGAVYRLTPPVPPATAWTESLVYNFTGQPSDGANPISGLTFDTSGALYGATGAGGRVNKGAVYKLSR